jgi:hypothetical protein
MWYTRDGIGWNYSPDKQGGFLKHGGWQVLGRWLQFR